MWTLWNKIYFIKTVFENFMEWSLKGGFQLMLILVPLGMHFDAVVVFVTSQTLLFWLALAILCTRPFFWPKTNNHLSKKFLSLNITWVKVGKMSKILTFKVNFLCQKGSKSFYFFFIEEYHLWSTFFGIDIFWQLQFLNHFIF